jgi:glutathione synthase/RimK-type ligase-like ATP-grasp enzyme
MHILLATSRNQPALTSSDSILRDELERRGAQVRGEPWDDILPNRESDCLVCLRSTWDYSYRSEEFKHWISAWHHLPGRLWNPPAMVLWNLDKIYLRDLASAGIRIPTTNWFAPGQPPDVDGFLARHKIDEAVVKPRISASARGTQRVRAGTDLKNEDLQQLLAVGSLLQAFVPEIQDNGELSLVFIGSRLSHAVHKQPTSGDFRVQKRFGGSVRFYNATEEERTFGEEVLATLPRAPLYARVDLVHTASGPVLMELEIIEPELYMDIAPSGAARFADEIVGLLEPRGAGGVSRG